MLFLASFRTSINFRIYTPAFPIRSAYPQFSSYTYTIPFSNLIISLFPSLPIQASQVYVRIGFLPLTLESLGQSVRRGLMLVTPQSKEFPYPFYTPTDSIIGSIFYFTTGLHGLHVIFGSLGWFIILFWLIPNAQVQFIILRYILSSLFLVFGSYGPSTAALLFTALYTTK